MDPLTALSLAGTIVQFVDFGSRLFTDSREFYKSTTGTLKANEVLELIISDLRALVVKVNPCQRLLALVQRHSCHLT
jgi:hypothetical protein